MALDRRSFFSFNYHVFLRLTEYGKKLYQNFYDNKHASMIAHGLVIAREDLPVLHVDEAGWTRMSIFEYMDIFSGHDAPSVFIDMEIESL